MGARTLRSRHDDAKRQTVLYLPLDGKVSFRPETRYAGGCHVQILVEYFNSTLNPFDNDDSFSGPVPVGSDAKAPTTVPHVLKVPERGSRYEVAFFAILSRDGEELEKKRSQATYFVVRADEKP